MMRRGRRTDGRIIECALCADPDEQNAGSRAGRRPLPRNILIAQPCQIVLARTAVAEGPQYCVSAGRARFGGDQER